MPDGLNAAPGHRCALHGLSWRHTHNLLPVGLGTVEFRDRPVRPAAISRTVRGRVVRGHCADRTVTAKTLRIQTCGHASSNEAGAPEIIQL